MVNEIIKKHLGLTLAGVVVALLSPAAGHAAFVSKGTQTLIGSAAVGGTSTIAIVSANIKNRSNGTIVGALSWAGSNPTPGAGFLVSDQYIEVVSSINVTDGGIQIYTDNTNGTGVSKFTGLISSYTITPAGLVDNSDQTQKLPTAWLASTGTIASITGIDPNANSGTSYNWFYHEDHAQVAVPSLNAARFVNGDPYVTWYASPGTPLTDPNGNVFTTTALNSGIHFAQGPTQFGGFSASATTELYTEADFDNALVGTTYSTTKLVLEAFSL